MKINLNNKINKNTILGVRNQIRDKGDLKRFDEFIAKHEIFDISNNSHMRAAQNSCDPFKDLNLGKCELSQLKIG